MFRNSSHNLTVTAILAMALGVAACSGLTQSDRPAVSVWWLQSLESAPGAGDPTGPVPVVLEFDVVPGLDSQKILALTSDAQLKPYAGARWADDLPELVASLLQRSLQASGRFEVLQPGRAGASAATCELHLELNEFFADLEAGDRTRGVRVGLDGSYRCGKAGTLALASRADVGVDTERMSDIVAAFQKALDQVTLDLIKQIDIKQ